MPSPLLVRSSKEEERRGINMSIFDLFDEIAKEKQSVGAISHLIVGLGNPGKEYALTRHNAGFLALDRLAEKMGVSVTKGKYHALVAEGTLAGKRVLLMKPQTYMNLSGQAVQEAMAFYHLEPSQLLVFSDDVNLEVGKLRLRKKGSHGGQKGLLSIIEHLGTSEFPRIRLGVGKNEYPDLADWVLGKIPKEQMPAFSEALDHAVCAAELVLTGDFDRAMCLYN